MLNTENDPLVMLTLKLREQYQALDSIVEAMNHDSDQSIDLISEQLKVIKKTETMLRPLREEFRRTNTKLPPHLQEPTDQTIELVKGLMPKLAQLEKTTLDSAQRLFPKIQESVRAVQMQNAYQASRAS